MRESHRTFLAGPVLLGLLAALAHACTGVPDSRSSGGLPASDSGVAGSGVFGYAPSNVAVDLAAEDQLADLVFEGAACESAARIDTDDCRVDCVEGADCEIALQADGTQVAILYAGRFIVREGVDVEIEGGRPLVVVAGGGVEIRGSIAAIDPIYHFNGRAGGYGCEFNTTPTSGDGQGGGGASYGSGGAGGGGHCGAGGAGGSGEEGSLGPGRGGDPYGDVRIVPLEGGSAGGKRALGTGGAGGGAVQISSAVSIAIEEGGAINMSGNGGKGNAGGGGGAGGAILLEAPVVRIAGTLAANGGGGGSGGLGGDGMSGRPGSEPAAGGVSDDGATGGDGAYGGAFDGAVGGAFDGGISGGGGGGGAGVIRINTADGGAEIPGVVSPAIGSGCASVGGLASL
jgi:hypothetical protein